MIKFSFLNGFCFGFELINGVEVVNGQGELTDYDMIVFCIFVFKIHILL